VGNYDSGYAKAVFKDMCVRRRGKGCPLAFSMGYYGEVPTAAKTDALLGRTCTNHCYKNETHCKMYGLPPKTCDPPSPAVPGPAHWHPALYKLGMAPASRFAVLRRR